MRHWAYALVVAPAADAAAYWLTFNQFIRLVAKLWSWSKSKLVNQSRPAPPPFSLPRFRMTGA
jgi:hypothetical protein